MKIFTSFIFLLITTSTISQSLYSNVFIYGNKSFIETHYDVRDKPDYTYDTGYYFLFGYRHTISKKNKLNVYFQYSKFRPYCTISTNRNPNINLLSIGNSIIYSYYLDLGLQKKINLHQNIAFLTLSLGIRRANIQIAWHENKEIKGLGIIHYYAFPNNYYLPQFQIGLDFKIRRRWHFTIMKMYTFGLYGRFQEILFDYTFKGDSIPTTKTYINGTTHQFHIGIQFDLIIQNHKQN